MIILRWVGKLNPLIQEVILASPIIKLENKSVDSATKNLKKMSVLGNVV